MTFKFYKCNDDKRVIDKTLNNEYSTSGYIKEDCSIMSPVLVINTTTNLSQYNYCYLSLFSRYYYITDIITVSNNIWEIHLSIDVLKTYSTAIRNLDECIVNRSTQNANYYLNDNQLSKDAYENVLTRRFNQRTPFSFDSSKRHYLFITTGG